MASKQNRKLSGAILTGAFITPAIMSAAQQNVASADFSRTAKEFLSGVGGYIAEGVKQNPIVGLTTIAGGIVIVAAIGRLLYCSFKGNGIEEEEDKEEVPHMVNPYEIDIIDDLKVLGKKISNGFSSIKESIKKRWKGEKRMAESSNGESNTHKEEK